MISKRAEILFKETPPLVEAHFKCAADPYHIETNRDGYINFGTAENFLLEEKLVEKISTIPNITGKTLHYDFPWGSEALRTSYASFAEKFLGIENINSDNIAVGCGLSAIIEILSFSVFDEGDKVLTIAPLYNGFYHDFETRFKAKIELSHSIDRKGVINREILSKDLKNTGAKFLLINNPHNPIGHCYSKSDIRMIIEVAKENSVFIIADEVYANSVFGDSEFISFLSEEFNDLDYKESILHLYGLAKDFALSGFKVGFFLSHNEKVTKAVQSLTYFHTVSTHTQHIVNNIISDHKWCEELFNYNNEILKETFSELTNGLDSIGIDYYPSNSGIFTMIDLTPYMKEKTAQAEMELFNFLIDELKISITPGQFFGEKNYGFFRVCYAKPNETLKSFLQRLSKLKEK